jgi:hypothetical protein
MSIILLVVFGFVLIVFKYNKAEKVICSCLISGLALGCFIIIPWAVSYSTYLGMKSFYEATYEQYFNAIEIYQDRAVIDTTVAFTDFKYQGYQDNISGYITDLRDKSIWYNELYIKKETMNNNIFFSWYIIPPSENMKLMRLK